VQETSTREERVLAALAHAGVLANIFNLIGMIGAALIWATQHKQSRYVAEHALQALLFQLSAFVLTVVMLLSWGGCLLISLLPAFLRPELYRYDLPLAFRVALFAGVLILVFVAIIIVYGVFGALAAWRGRMFHYAAVNMLLQMRESRDEQAVEEEADTPETPETGAQTETEHPDTPTEGAEAAPGDAPAEPAAAERSPAPVDAQEETPPVEASVSEDEQAEPEPQPPAEAPPAEEKAGEPPAADDDKQRPTGPTDREAKD
jgi:uncharacterized Tic20 family protein